MASTHHRQYGADAVTEYVALHGRVPNRRSLLTKFILGDPETGTAPLSDTEIGDELANMAFAATDTTGNTMTYALYRLCCHPAWQQKLRDEILASGARDAGFAFQSLQALPILNSVVMETLRFHPSIPSALPRVTAARETVIAGLVLPQDVRPTRDPHVPVPSVGLTHWAPACRRSYRCSPTRRSATRRISLIQSNGGRAAG